MADVGVILYPEQEAIIEFLTDAQRGQLLSALFELSKGKEPMPEDKMVAMALTFFKMRHAQNKQHYDEVRKARSEAGKKHKGNQYTQAKEKEQAQKEMEQMGQNGTNGTNNNNNINNIAHSNTDVLSCDNNAHARTQGKMEQNGTNGTLATCDDYAAELIQDEIFAERTAMALHATSSDILVLVNNFNAEQSIKQTAHVDYNDYRRHAYDWIRIQIEKRQKEQRNGNPNDNIRQAQERQLARLNKIAARDREVS